MSMERGVTEESYTLKIYLDGRSPKTIQIRPLHNRLIISSDSLEMQREQDRDGYGYSQRWGGSSRTIRLPTDADANGLVRTDGEDAIDISAPRISYRR
jgi:HSP20 family molecular chaperone IbpA